MFISSLNNDLTRGNKSEIVAWDRPDFSSGVSFATPYNGVTYEAPSNGWVFGYISVAAGHYNYVYVNGKEVQTHVGNSWGDLFPVAKGDIVTTDAANGSFVFYPCRGL